MAATAEAAKTVGVAEMLKAAKAAEWVAIMEAEAVKNAAGAAVGKIKVARILNPVIIPLAPTATFV